MSLSLRERLRSSESILAPLVLNPLMARLAEAAGFSAGYVGGGALGYQACGTEANLSLTQLLHVGLEIRAHSEMPLILDGTCGWGDPVHVRHTVQNAEAAGFSAIEIEDQILPKRVHHHVGIEHLIPLEAMAAKVSEAVAARKNRDFLIIARTNAARVLSLEEALRRGEAYRRAGADVLLVMCRNTDDIRAVGRHLPRPLMYMVPLGGLTAIGMPLTELAAHGFTLVVDPGTPFFAATHALRRSYAALRAGALDPLIGSSAPEEEKMVHNAIGLGAMLEIERRTVGV